MSNARCGQIPNSQRMIDRLLCSAISIVCSVMSRICYAMTLIIMWPLDTNTHMRKRQFTLFGHVVSRKKKTVNFIWACGEKGIAGV